MPANINALCHLEDEQDINARVGTYNKIPGLCLGNNVTIFATEGQLLQISAAITAYFREKYTDAADPIKHGVATVESQHCDHCGQDFIGPPAQSIVSKSGSSVLCGPCVEKANERARREIVQSLPF